jgi:hypothetical protein
LPVSSRSSFSSATVRDGSSGIEAMLTRSETVW